MSVHEAVARNHSHASENRIHSDDIARRYGFRGALVPGVAVFGHMTYPIVAEHGVAWLGHSSMTTRFLKPAYDGDRMSIRATPHGRGHRVTCHNAEGDLLAELDYEVPAELPHVDKLALLPGASTSAPRVEISSELIDIGEPFQSIRWTPTTEENRTYADRVADDQTVYRNGVVHPHLMLHWSNQALVRRYVMPTWIHVGSDIQCRRVLRVGDDIEIRAVPMEKWVRKGHEFIKLYVAYFVDGAAAVEVYHTAIYRVAPKAG